jgi:hypothetical protein
MNEVTTTNFRILNYQQQLNQITAHSIQYVAKYFVQCSRALIECDTYESDKGVLCIPHGSGTPEVSYSIRVDILVAPDSQYRFLQPSLDDTCECVDDTEKCNICYGIPSSVIQALGWRHVRTVTDKYKNVILIC